jgi:predicted RNA-binding Zn ribbon-like protein
VSAVAIPLLGTDETPHVYGGRLSLSLVNSLWWRRSEEPIEQLHEYADVLMTVARSGWLKPEVRAAIEVQARKRPTQARRQLTAVLDLRGVLHTTFATVAAGGQPAPDLLGLIQQAAAPGLAELRLSPAAGSGYQLGWTRPTLELPLQQLAVSAMLLLSSAELDRVKQCPGSTCGWVFLDESRNRSRRWCDSRECGNRERVRAHYERTHGVSPRARTTPAAAQGPAGPAR